VAFAVAANCAGGGKRRSSWDRLEIVSVIART
jgi:hypothetical protein